ncbi:SGNH/GDSL hydrolase family protein [Roseimaritima sediminicola]|uniref:SGNH/GDSL hydrolase family protein n=1 Tax=Roseimaritima sediminicola TaxID=2662066 RepID=UPI0012985017|nr:SGNH/GDSL hydrolase family protein [Roseimaritima sediminicola]
MFRREFSTAGRLTAVLCSVVVSWTAAPTSWAADPPSSNVEVRGQLQNARLAFSQNASPKVVFMGGSITEMDGYRPLVCQDLQRRFPKAEFEFINAGISSTCSTTGAFRLQRDVLAHDPDLLFVEFAVNDDQDAGHAARECLRGMEGIVRHARKHNPHMDIVMVHFVNPGMLATRQRGETPTSSGQHERVAEYYRISSVDVAGELADRIAAGTFSWQQYGGTHPKPQGNRLAADLVAQLLDASWQHPLPEDAQAQPAILPEPLDTGSYFRGQFLTPGHAEFGRDWQLGKPDWDSLPGSKRQRFLDEDFLHSTRPGATLRLEFTGSAIGAFVLAGPDAGQVEVSIDGGPFRTVELYHHYSRGLHYPRTVMFATDLEPVPHEMTLRVGQEHAEASEGHAVRIMQFTVN